MERQGRGAAWRDDARECRAGQHLHHLEGRRAKDFELRLSFRCNATNNSGIQYRSRHITEGSVRNKWVVRGYQHEIRNENKLPSVSGFIYDEGGKRGRMCLVGERAVWGEDGQKQVTGTLISAEEYQRLFKLDDWNNVVIIAQGPCIRHYLNNRLILESRTTPLNNPAATASSPCSSRGIPDVGRVQEFTPQKQRMRPAIAPANRCVSDDPVPFSVNEFHVRESAAI